MGSEIIDGMYQQNPNDAFKKGLELTDLGFYKEAMEIFQRELLHNENDYYLLNNLGYVTLLSGLKDKNTDLVKESILLLSKSVDCFYELNGKESKGFLGEANLLRAKDELAKLK